MFKPFYVIRCREADGRETYLCRDGVLRSFIHWGTTSICVRQWYRLSAAKRWCINRRPGVGGKFWIEHDTTGTGETVQTVYEKVGE